MLFSVLRKSAVPEVPRKYFTRALNSVGLQSENLSEINDNLFPLDGNNGDGDFIFVKGQVE